MKFYYNWTFRRCLKLSYYESPGSKVEEYHFHGMLSTNGLLKVYILS